MTGMYPWLSSLATQCASIDKPCGILISGAPHTGIDRFVVTLLQDKWEIADPSNHPDILSIDSEEKAIGIDEIRELVKFTQIKPTRLAFKCVIINPLNALTVAAQQSFLKTLEEALVPTYFFMLCHNMNRILPTIKSRSQTMSMGEISPTAIAEYGQRLGISFDDNDLMIAQYAPLYHERPDYPSFKKVFVESLDVCLEGRAWSTASHAWEKIPADIQLSAMMLALTEALKRDHMNPVLQKWYSQLVEVARMKEMNNNINLGMHLCL